ncbi:hypothetical protein ACOMHN_032937 [Nucella lapillus]
MTFSISQPTDPTLSLADNPTVPVTTAHQYGNASIYQHRDFQNNQQNFAFNIQYEDINNNQSRHIHNNKVTNNSSDIYNNVNESTYVISRDRVIIVEYTIISSNVFSKFGINRNIYNNQYNWYSNTYNNQYNWYSNIYNNQYNWYNSYNSQYNWYNTYNNQYNWYSNTYNNQYNWYSDNSQYNWYNTYNNQYNWYSNTYNNQYNWYSNNNQYNWYNTYNIQYNWYSNNIQYNRRKIMTVCQDSTD